MPWKIALMSSLAVQRLDEGGDGMRASNIYYRQSPEGEDIEDGREAISEEILAGYLGTNTNHQSREPGAQRIPRSVNQKTCKSGTATGRRQDAEHTEVSKAAGEKRPRVTPNETAMSWFYRSNNGSNLEFCSPKNVKTRTI